MVGFIAFSTLMMVVVGNAAALLIIARRLQRSDPPRNSGRDALCRSQDPHRGHRVQAPHVADHPGRIVVVIALYSGIQAVPGILKLFA